MRPVLSLLSVLVLMFFGCSPSGEGPNCDACEIQGQRVSFCENEDGTYYLASGGETRKYSAEKLENAKITFEELKKQMCESGEISF